MTGPASPPFILALDIGTSGARALLFDREGREVEGMVSYQDYQFQVFPDGGVEIDARLVLDSIYHCLDQVLVSAGNQAADIVGVAACTFVSNILGVDAQGQAITPVYAYADTRPSQENQALRDRLDEEAVHQRTGCYFHTSYLPSRFLWLKRTDPEALERAQRWISLGEYLWLELFGTSAISYSVASWTGLLDRRQLIWDQELLSVLPIQADKLSPLCDLDQPNQGLRGEFARRWPALARIPWFPAVGDGAAANIGSGSYTSRQAAISFGSTCAVRAVLDTSVDRVPPGLWCYRVDRRRNLLGGALTEGGNFISWLRNLLKMEGIDDPEEALLGALPGRHRLVFLPLVAGERSPGWRPEARGCVAGLTLATTPLDVMQAGLEGVICRIAQVYALLEQVLPAGPQIIASGGAARHSRFLVSNLADALGQPVFTSQISEASARGVALLALEALEMNDPSQLSHPVSLTGQPDLERHATYKKLIQDQQQLYRQLFPD